MLCEEILTFRLFFSGFRKFQWVEFWSLMRSHRFMGKLTADLSRRIKRPREALSNFNIMLSLETKLPNLQTSFQNKRTVSYYLSGINLCMYLAGGKVGAGEPG